jgi:hypothetical protein
MIDRRKYERFQLELPVRLIMNSPQRTEMFELQTRDISAAGAFLKTAERFSLGTRCLVELTGASERIRQLTGAQSLIKVEGIVVRSSPEGVATCFDGDCQILGLKGS